MSEIAEKPKRIKQQGVKRRPTGRPTTFTPAIGRKICEIVGKGAPRAYACRALGISQKTVSAWYIKGCNDLDDEVETPLAEFAEALGRAEAEFVIRKLELVDSCGEGGALVHRKVSYDRNGNECISESFAPPDWRAVERQLWWADPENFAPKREIKHSGTIRQERIDLKIDVAQLPPGQAIGIAQALASLQKALPDAAGQTEEKQGAT